VLQTLATGDFDSLQNLVGQPIQKHARKKEIEKLQGAVSGLYVFWR
jgi:thiamine pyrophosphokinase